MGVDPVELSPYHHITSDAPPCVIFHGTKDPTVPFMTVELFTEKMVEVGADCTLHGYEGEGHRSSTPAGKGRRKKNLPFRRP